MAKLWKHLSPKSEIKLVKSIQVVIEINAFNSSDWAGSDFYCSIYDNTMMPFRNYNVLVFSQTETSRQFGKNSSTTIKRPSDNLIQMKSKDSFHFK